MAHAGGAPSAGLARGAPGARRGVLNLPGVEEDVGLIGIHWRGRFIELVPWNGSVRRPVRNLRCVFF